MDPFTKEPNKRCLNGLAFDYQLSVDIDTEQLAAAIQAAFPATLIRLDESLGELRIARLILKFVLECRIGERARQVSLIHRMSANQQQRHANETLLEKTFNSYVSQHPNIAVP